LGIAAGLIILFECAIVLRKTSWFRARRWIGSGQFWMKAHIWLGLLSVPLAFLHAGFRFGGPFTSLMMWCYCIVVISGVVGLVIQNILPRLLLDLVQGETIYSQIDNVAAQFVNEAARIVALTCGDGTAAELPTERKGGAARPDNPLQVVVAQRKVGATQSRSPQGSVDFPLVSSAQALRYAFEKDLRQFLETGRSETGVLSTRRKSDQYFDGLRQLISSDAGHALDVLEDLCRRRQDFNLQKRLHLILHGWLFVHLPISLALLILLVAHVFFALKIG
jgi:hypothetical protein